MLAKRSWRTAARVGAAAVLAGALAVAGCAGPGAPVKRAATPEASAAASVSASDAALLNAVESTRAPTDELTNRVVRRAEQLADELAAAPFVAETTVTLPGVREGSSVRLPTAPKGNPKLRDRYEPDGSRAGASVLHMGSTQTRTISRVREADWIALPKDEGRGYYYITASKGGLLVDGLLLRSGEAIDYRPDWTPGRTDTECYQTTPAGDYPRLGKYSWIKVTSDVPVTYRVSHLKSLPQSLVGDSAPGEVMRAFGDPLLKLDATGYFKMTGLRATPSELRAFRDALFGGEAPASVWAGELQSPTDSAVQRCLGYMDGPDDPVACWLRTEKRGGSWVLVAAGRDASWKSASYAEKLRTYLLLEEWIRTRNTKDKPVIYLYPSREQSVTVRLDGSGVLTSTSPVIDSTTRSWTVTAKPDGTLTDAAGQRWPYLFWEGLGVPRFDLSTGSVVRGAEVDAFLRAALAERGLNASESREFREYWVPRLSASPWVLVHFEGAVYEVDAPLTVTPKPDISLRVFMVAQSLERPIAVAPQQLPPAPKRSGFTLVEWGGTLLP